MTAARCTCQAPSPWSDGPDVDCPQHGDPARLPFEAPAPPLATRRTCCDPATVTEAIDGTWLVERHDHHTCGAGPGSGAGHEPGCGLVPLVDLRGLPGWDALVATARRDAHPERCPGCGDAQCPRPHLECDREAPMSDTGAVEMVREHYRVVCLLDERQTRQYRQHVGILLEALDAAGAPTVEQMAEALGEALWRRQSDVLERRAFTFSDAPSRMHYLAHGRALAKRVAALWAR